MEGGWLDIAISSSETWGEKLHGSAVAFKIPHPTEVPLVGENVETDLLGLGEEGMMKGRVQEDKT